MRAAINIILLLVVVHQVNCQKVKGYQKVQIASRTEKRSTAARVSMRGKIYLAAIQNLSQQTTPWYERYSPWMGYEPYWVGGDWILDIVTTTLRDYWYYHFFWGWLTDRNYAPTTPIYVCGKPCEDSFRNVGPVCTINMGIYWFLWYDSYKPGAHKNEYPYRSFNTYCDYLAVNCRMDVSARYGLVHLGHCLQDRHVYLQTYYRYWEPADRKAQSSRIAFYFNDLYKRWTKVPNTPFKLTETYSTTLKELSLFWKIVNFLNPVNLVPWIWLG